MKFIELTQGYFAKIDDEEAADVYDNKVLEARPNYGITNKHLQSRTASL